MIKNIEWIKISNVKRAINYARRMEHFSKREMANALDICFTTASNIVNTLESVSVLEGVVVPKNGGPGRSTKWYQLRDERLLFLVVNFSNNSCITVALANLRHEVVGKIRFSLAKGEGWSVLSEKLKGTYSLLLKSTKSADENVVAVGVSVQGSYNAVADILFASDQPATHERHIRADFEALFSKRAIIQNDIDIAAAYTARTHDKRYLVYVYLDYQIGIGVITGGKVLTGMDGLTTEIAHAPLGSSNRICPSCGARSCLELSLGKGAFLEQYFEREFPICAEGYEREWIEFIEAVIQQDAKALKIVSQKAELLTRMLIVILAITRSSTIVIGGICRELFEVFETLLKDKIREWKKKYSVCDILFDPYAERTILIGTMDAVYQKWYPDFENGQHWVDQESEDINVTKALKVR